MTNPPPKIVEEPTADQLDAAQQHLNDEAKALQEVGCQNNYDCHDCPYELVCKL